MANGGLLARIQRVINGSNDCIKDFVNDKSRVGKVLEKYYWPFSGADKCGIAKQSEGAKSPTIVDVHARNFTCPSLSVTRSSFNSFRWLPENVELKLFTF